MIGGNLKKKLKDNRNLLPDRGIFPFSFCCCCCYCLILILPDRNPEAEDNAAAIAGCPRMASFSLLLRSPK